MKLIPILPGLVATPRVAESAFVTGVCTSTMAIYPSDGPAMPWVGYLAEVDGEWVGSCAFKSPPVDGAVEIAYFTFPGHEGRGYAARMARELVTLAREHGAAQIRAQTLPEPNASTRILEKLGFRWAGAVQHPEDGTVWEWQLS